MLSKAFFVGSTLCDWCLTVLYMQLTHSSFYLSSQYSVTNYCELHIFGKLVFAEAGAKAPSVRWQFLYEGIDLVPWSHMREVYLI